MRDNMTFALSALLAFLFAFLPSTISLTSKPTLYVYREKKETQDQHLRKAQIALDCSTCLLQQINERKGGSESEEKAFEYYEKAIGHCLKVTSANCPQLKKLFDQAAMLKPTYELLFAEYREKKDREEQVINILLSFAAVSCQKSQFAEAVAHYKDVLGVLKKRPNQRNELVRISCAISRLYVKRGNKKKALELAQTVFNQYSTSQEKPKQLAPLFVEYGNFCRMNAQKFLAIKYYLKAIELYSIQGEKALAKMRSIYAQLGRLYKTQGKLDKAIEHYEKAILPLAEGKSAPLFFAHVCNNLANLLSLKGPSKDTQKAERYYRQALSCYKDPFFRAETYLNLTLLYYDKKEYDGAEGSVKKAIEGYQKVVQQKPQVKRKLADSLFKLGNILQAKAKLEASPSAPNPYPQKAITAFEQGRSLYQELGAKTFIARTAFNIGLGYYKLYRYEKAIAYLKEAKNQFVAEQVQPQRRIKCDAILKDCEIQRSKCGDADHSNAPQLYKSDEKETKSEENDLPKPSSGSTLQIDTVLEEQKQKVEALIDQYGAESPELFGVYNTLGFLFSSAGSNKEAIEYYKKALEISDKNSYADHPSLVVTYANLGNTYAKIEDDQKAIEMLEKALELYLFSDEKESIVITGLMEHIVFLYKKNKNLPTNRTYSTYLKALDYLPKKRSSDHPELAKGYLHMGSLLYCKKKPLEAIDYFNKARHILEEKSEPGDRFLFLVYVNLGNVYCQQGNPDKGIDWWEKALKFHLFSDKKECRLIINLIDTLARTYKARNSKKALPKDFPLDIYLKALRFLQKELQPIDLRLMTTYHNMGTIIYSQKHREGALAYFQDALAVARNSAPPIDELEAQFCLIIGYLYEEKFFYDQAIKHYKEAKQIYLEKCTNRLREVLYIEELMAGCENRKNASSQMNRFLQPRLLAQNHQLVGSPPNISQPS